MRKAFLLLPIILGLVYVITTAYSSGPGASGYERTGATGVVGCGGGGCHGTTATTAIAVTIELDTAGSSTPLTRYYPGGSYLVKITGVDNVTSSTSSLPRFGFQLTAVKLAGSGASGATMAGTFGTSLPSSCQNSLVSSLHVIEQSSPILSTTGSGAGAGSTTYVETIPWTAPATGTGTVKLFGVVNAVNYDGGASAADKWNGASDTVSEAIPTAATAAITGTDSVCQGDSVVLHDATSGGTWSSSVTSVATVSSTGGVYAVAGGYTTISYTAAGGTSTVTFHVLPHTSLSPISGPTTLCAGSTITLTDTASGGTWSSSASSIASVSPSGVVTGMSSGTATITYQVTGICGTAFGTHSVTVAAGSSAGTLSGPATVCPGGTISITDAGGATGGTWSSSNTAIATVNSAGSVTAVTAGTVIISYSVSSSCGSAVATHTVTVIPATNAGTISGPTFVCTGTTASFSETVGTGTWSSTSTSIATVTAGGVVTAVSPGSDTIKYTVTGSCGTAVAYKVITVASSAATAGGYLRGPDSVCQGGTITIVDSAGVAGGTWSSRSTSVATVGATGVVTGVALGTSVISYTITTGSCGSDTVTRSITVLSGLPAITGTPSTCVGSVDSLHNAVSGGLWSSSNTAIAAAAAGFGTVTGVRAGTVAITYTAPSGCRAIDSFTVYPIPSPILGATPVCAGNHIAVSDTTSGGTWSSHNSAIATITSGGIVTGVTASTTTISYTNTHGCSVTASILVNPVPAFITGNYSLCSTLTDSLFDLTPGGTWSSVNPSIATIGSTTGLLTGVSGGTATVSYTLPTGCAAVHAITVHPLPVPTIALNWGTNTLSTANYYTSYKWYKNGVLITGATTSSVAATTNGTYTVYVTDTFGCENMSDPYIIVNLAVNQPGLSQNISIHPNPASDVVYIESPVAVNAVVTGMEGKVIMQVANATNVDISALPAGVYMMLFYDESGAKLSVEKFVKK